jgi:hypothetical protein
VHTLGGLLIGVGVVIAVVAVVWWFVASARRPRSDASSTADRTDTADVTVGVDTVVIIPRGAWKVLALTRSLTIPVAQITDCRVDADPRASHPVTLRVGGSSLPGTLRAGYMIGAGGRSWWLCRSGANAVVIELEGNALAYLVIEVGDPAELVARVRHAVAAASSTD